MPKTYKTSKGVYTIPDDQAGAFIKDFPDATEVQSYKVGNDTYDIPIKDTANFAKQFPNATPLNFDSPEVKQQYNNNQQDNTNVPRGTSQNIDESVPPPTADNSIDWSNNIAGIREKHQENEDAIKAQQSIIASQRMAPGIVPVSNQAADPELQKGIDGEEGMVNATATGMGVKPEDLKSVMNDFKYTNNAAQLKAAIDTKQTNPYLYNRSVAKHNWWNVLTPAITEKDPQNASQIIGNLYNQQLIPNQSFDQATKDLQNKIALVHQYIDDPATQDEVIKNLKADASINYGGNAPGTNEILSAMPNANLNNNQKLALKYLQDSGDPTAKSFDMLNVDPAKLDDNQKLGFEEKAKYLDNLGVNLRLNQLGENISTLKDKAAKGTITPQETEQLKNEYVQATALNQYQNDFKYKYPKSNVYDLMETAQELTGQRHGFLANMALTTGNATSDVGGAVSDAYNWLTTPFRSNADNFNNIRDLGVLGDKTKSDYSTYTTQANQLQQGFETKVSPRLQGEIDYINKTDLSDDDKQMAVAKLLQSNSDDWYKQEVNGRLNITGKSFLYGAGHAVANIAPFIATSFLTGGLGDVGKAQKALSTFGSAFATGYHENYEKALQDNNADPEANALRTTAVQSIAMVAGEKIDAIKGMINPETPIGQTIQRMSDDEIQAALTKKPQIFKDISQSIGKSLAQGAKGGAQMSAANVGGQIVNDLINGQVKSPGDYAKDFVVQTLTTTPLGLLGAKANYDDISKGGKTAIFESATDPDKYKLATDDAVRNGTISPLQGEQIKTNIDNAAKVYDKTDFTSNKGKPLSDDKKIDLLASRLKEEQLKQQISLNQPDVRKEALKAQLEQHQADQEQIYVTPYKKEADISTEPSNNENEEAKAKEIAPQENEGVVDNAAPSLPENKIVPASENIKPNDQYQTMNMGNDEGKPETPEARKIMKERFLQGDTPMDGEGGKGETGKQFVSRVINEWEKTKANEPENTTVVTHSSVLKAIKTWENGNWLVRPHEMTTEQWHEFAKEYNTESTDNGDLETFKGTNGKIHVIRHGETQDNQEHNFRSAETNLTDKGKQQAVDVGQQLKEKTNGNVPQIITSDLPRAIHTSNIINEQLNGNKNETEKQSGQNKSNAVNSSLPNQEKEKTINERLKGIDETQITEPYDKVLHYFANDGKIHSSAINEIFGGKDDRIRQKSSTENEKRSRIGLLGKNAPTIDELAHKLWESDTTEKHDTRDYKNAIEQVLSDHNSKATMAKELVERYDVDAAYDKYYSQFGDEFANIYNSLSEEDINHLLQLDAQENSQKEIDQYFEQLNPKDNASAQSSEQQQTSNQQSGEPEHAPVEQTGSEAAPTSPESSDSNIGGEGEEKVTGIKKAITEPQRAERVLPSLNIPKLGSDSEVLQHGKDLVESGKIDPRQMVDDILTENKALNVDEKSAMQYYMHQLAQDGKDTRQAFYEADKKATDSPTDIDAQNDKLIALDKLNQHNDEMDRALDALKKVQANWGQGGRIMQIAADQHYNPVNIRKEIDANYGVEAPKAVKDRIDAILKERDAAVKETNDLKEQIAKLQAQLDESTKSKTKKASGDYKAERAKIVENIKDKWSKAGKDTLQLSVPYGAQFAAIAPDVLELFKSYANEGIDKVSDIVNKIYDDIKDHVAGISKDDIHGMIADNEADKLNAIAEKKEARLASGETAPKNPNPKVKQLTEALAKAQQRVANAEFKIRNEQRKALESNKSKTQRALAWAIRWNRRLALSGLGVVQKIATAGAIGDAATYPLKEGIGWLWSKALPKLAKDAPIEGGANLKAAIEYYKRLFNLKRTLKNAKDIYVTGSTDLSKRLKEETYPHYAGWDALVDSHTVLKDPFKEAEFNSAVTKATAWAQKKGWDISDPLVSKFIETMGFKKANEAIFNEDNTTVSNIRNFVKNSLDKNTETGNIGATEFAANMMMPVGKVPTNIVKHLGWGITGIPRGLMEARKMFKQGIENFTPEQKDHVFKMLKAGTLGNALLTTGALLAYSSFGGLYNQFDTKKRKPSEIPVGGAKIDGIEVPKYAEHALPMQMLQTGATMRRLTDYYRSKGDNIPQALGQGIWGTGWSILSEIPAVNLAERLSDSRTPYGEQKLINSIAQMPTPQILKDYAKSHDVDANNNPIVRKPKDMVDAFKETLPGLREEVPKNPVRYVPQSDQNKPSWKFLTDKGVALPTTNVDDIKLNIGGKKVPLTDTQKDKFADERTKFIDDFLTKAISENKTFGGKTLKDMSADELKAFVKKVDTRATEIAKLKIKK